MRRSKHCTLFLRGYNEAFAKVNYYHGESSLRVNAVRYLASVVINKHCNLSREHPYIALHYSTVAIRKDGFVR